MANPIIPWLGGKRRLADTFLRRFPGHGCYVEVFAGGPALSFLKHPAEVELINDVNGELVNLYRVVKHQSAEFLRQFKYALSSRHVFTWLQDTSPDTLTNVQRPARFFYLQRQAFGGRVEVQTWGTAPRPRPSTSCGSRKTSARPTSAWLAPVSSTSTGRPASTSTTARTPCSTRTRRTTRPKSMASPLPRGNSTS